MGFGDAVTSHVAMVTRPCSLVGLGTKDADLCTFHTAFVIATDNDNEVVYLLNLPKLFFWFIRLLHVVHELQSVGL